VKGEVENADLCYSSIYIVRSRGSELSRTINTWVGTIWILKYGSPFG